MLCRDIKKQIVPFFMSELNETYAQKVREHLCECPGCRKHFESFQHVWSDLSHIREASPSDTLADKFAVMLNGYQHGVRESRRTTVTVWQKSTFAKPALQLGFTAVALLVGILIGSAVSLSPTRKDYQQISHELDDMRELVMLSLLKQQSSADRLQAVNYSYDFQQPRDGIRDALQQTLESDPSTNVRLSALRALRPFAHDASVRRKIVESFGAQHSPLLQIEIIDFIRQTETHAIELLELLEQEDHLTDAVRQHMKWTIAAR